MNSKIKKALLLMLFMLTVAAPAVLACTVCSQNQPKPLRNITHGTGPQSDMDYVIIMTGIVIVCFTLLYSLKFLIRPGEQQPDHIKNIVVDERYSA